MKDDIQIVSVKDLASLITGGPWLLTGESGAGKDYVAKTYLASSEFQALDALGAKKGEKWIVDVAKIDTTSVKQLRVYGVCDNLSEVAKALKDAYDEPKLNLLIIQPSYELFKATNAAKAQDAPESQAKWKEHWSARSTISLKEFNRLIASRNANYIRWTDPERVFICINDLREGDKVEHGWHKVQATEKFDSAEIQTTK